MKNYIEYSEEVKYAIDNKLPIVALESTIISHGMPYPENIKMANRVEEIIRSEGAVPATIAILEGKLCVGLDARIATSGGPFFQVAADPHLKNYRSLGR